MLKVIFIKACISLPFAVWLGLLGGGLVGVLAGALIRVIRTHRVFSLLSGSFLAALPSAAAGVAVSVIITIFQMALCDTYKGSLQAPIWSVGLQIIAIFIAGGVGAFLAQRPRRMTPHLRSTLYSAVLGAIIGTVAYVPIAFLYAHELAEKHWKPFLIYQAIIGFLFGGVVVLLWHEVIEIGYRMSNKAVEKKRGANNAPPQ